MAICRWCEREMTTAASCTATALTHRGVPIAMIPWGTEGGWERRMARAGSRCGDCGVEPHGSHHLGCDLQLCPLCRGQMLSCGCRFDEGPPDPDDPYAGFERDSNGCPTQRWWLGSQEVIVHHDDVPESDLTVVDGIPCTTALRTVIDIAPDTDFAELRRIVQDCLRRRLFTVEQARARLAQPDMLIRPGAHLLRHVLGP